MTLKAIRILLDGHGRGKVFLGDYDISAGVQRVQLVGVVDELPLVTLTMIVSAVDVEAFVEAFADVIVIPAKAPGA